MTRIARAGALLALALLTALSVTGPAAAKQPHKHGKGAHGSKRLPEKWSKQHKAKRATADPDDDGLTNWGEFRAHTKPRDDDSDRDGLGDAQEDRDRDMLDNGSEEDAGTDPGVKDSDRDGIRDGAEDPDRDGLSNTAEDRTGHEPRDPDTDDDGTLDGDENEAGPEDTAGDEDFGGDEPDEEPTDEELALLDEEGSADVRAHLAEQGAEAWGDDQCSGDLAPGTAVHEAAVENGVFTVLELVASER